MAKTGELTPGRQVVPGSDKRVADAVATLLPAYDRLRDGILAQRPSDCREGLASIRRVDCAALAVRLAEGQARASAVEITAAAAHLIAVTKHLDKVNGPVFQDTLVQFIADEQPTRAGLAIAMRQVILSARYTPSIAEVVEAIRAAESDLRSARRRLEWLPERIAEAESFLNRSM